MRTDDIGYLKTCRVEVLRGRVHHHTIVSNGSKGHKLVAGHDQFAVDFIARHLHTMLMTDVVHTLQFLTSPNTSRRVVRVTEQEECGLLIGTLCLEIIKIHFEAIANNLQRRFQYLATIVLDA